MPLKFAMQSAIEPELPAQPGVEAAPMGPAEPALDDLLGQFRGAVETVTYLAEERANVLARLGRGEQYLRAGLTGINVKQLLEALLPLEPGDEHAEGLARQIAKFAPRHAEAVALLLELRAKLADLDRRITREGEIQAAIEKRVAGEGQYICGHCFKVAGPRLCECCWPKDPGTNGGD
ncbi:MAG: hypothetical protein ACYC4L_04745 [Chloroflexota bacterium]